MSSQNTPTLASDTPAVPLSAFVPLEQRVGLIALAKGRGVSLSAEVRAAIDGHLTRARIAA